VEVILDGIGNNEPDDPTMKRPMPPSSEWRREKKTNLRMRPIVLIAVSTGMRSAEIHRLRWSDVVYSEVCLGKAKKG